MNDVEKAINAVLQMCRGTLGCHLTEILIQTIVLILKMVPQKMLRMHEGKKVFSE